MKADLPCLHLFPPLSCLTNVEEGKFRLYGHILNTWPSGPIAKGQLPLFLPILTRVSLSALFLILAILTLLVWWGSIAGFAIHPEFSSKSAFFSSSFIRPTEDRSDLSKDSLYGRKNMSDENCSLILPRPNSLPAEEARLSKMPGRVDNKAESEGGSGWGFGRSFLADKNHLPGWGEEVE